MSGRLRATATGQPLPVALTAAVAYAARRLEPHDGVRLLTTQRIGALEPSFLHGLTPERVRDVPAEYLPEQIAGLGKRGGGVAGDGTGQLWTPGSAV